MNRSLSSVLVRGSLVVCAKECRHVMVKCRSLQRGICARVSLSYFQR